MKKTILDKIRIILIAAILTFGIGIASAWTSPTYAPPVGNTLAPLNVSASDQTKEGSLLIENTSSSNGLIVVNGSVAIGKPDSLPPGSFAPTLDVKGTTNASAVCLNGVCHSGWFPAGGIGDKGDSGKPGSDSTVRGDTGPIGKIVSNKCLYSSKDYDKGVVCYNSLISGTGFNIKCTEYGWVRENSSAVSLKCGQ